MHQTSFVNALLCCCLCLQLSLVGLFPRAGRSCHKTSPVRQCSHLCSWVIEWESACQSLSWVKMATLNAGFSQRPRSLDSTSSSRSTTTTGDNNIANSSADDKVYLYSIVYVHNRKVDSLKVYTATCIFTKSNLTLTLTLTLLLVVRKCGDWVNLCRSV